MRTINSNYFSNTSLFTFPVFENFFVYFAACARVTLHKPVEPVELDGVEFFVYHPPLGAATVAVVGIITHISERNCKTETQRSQAHTHTLRVQQEQCTGLPLCVPV